MKCIPEIIKTIMKARGGETKNYFDFFFVNLFFLNIEIFHYIFLYMAWLKL